MPSNCKSLSNAMDTVTVCNELPERLTQQYHHEFKNLDSKKLDSYIYPLVKSFERFDDTIIPIFSCSGHNRKPLSLSFIVKNNGEQILKALFQLMLKVNNVIVINSGISIYYKRSVYDTLGNRITYSTMDNGYLLYPMYTVSLNYQLDTELSELINDFKNIVDNFDNPEGV